MSTIVHTMVKQKQIWSLFCLVVDRQNKNNPSQNHDRREEWEGHSEMDIQGIQRGLPEELTVLE